MAEVKSDDLAQHITLLSVEIQTALKKLVIPKVLVIYTGGTIGMKVKNRVYIPVPNFLHSALRSMNIMHNTEYADTINDIEPNKELLYLPLASDSDCIAYYILEYTPLLDSSNMTIDNYIQIALDVKELYSLFDGFVILHGTDTMSYTASALSFMFENLSKPIVLTGSQIPIFETRSDGRDNLIGSLIIAGQYRIPEVDVTVYFRNRLYRGSRVTKTDCEGLNAFESYNFPPLAEFRTNVQVKWDQIFDKSNDGPFNVHTNLNRNVSLLRLFPGITYITVRQFLEPPILGVVLQTYGAGNMPSNRPDILEELRKASDRGIIIVNCTQCNKGSVQHIYDTATYLNKIGVCPGYDMTIEAALMKLSYVLGKGYDLKTMKVQMAESLRGEMQGKVKCQKLDMKFFLNAPITQDLMQSCKMESNEDAAKFGQAFLPWLIASAAQTDDIDFLCRIQESLSTNVGLNVLMPSGSAPLHVAARNNSIKCASYFLQLGYNVNEHDQCNYTPLYYAVINNHFDMIGLFVKHGGHLELKPSEVGMYICSAVAENNVLKLQAWQCAGADLNQTDYDGRTAIHVAINHNSVDCVRYLVEHGVDVGCIDSRGYTPLEIARQRGYDQLVQLLSEYSDKSKSNLK